MTLEAKNLVCNNHTTSIKSYYTYFKFYEVHFSLLSLMEDFFSQLGMPMQVIIIFKKFLIPFLDHF